MIISYFGGWHHGCQKQAAHTCLTFLRVLICSAKENLKKCRFLNILKFFGAFSYLSNRVCCTLLLWKFPDDLDSWQCCTIRSNVVNSVFIDVFLYTNKRSQFFGLLRWIGVYHIIPLIEASFHGWLLEDHSIVERRGCVGEIPQPVAMFSLQTANWKKDDPSVDKKNQLGSGFHPPHYCLCSCQLNTDMVWIQIRMRGNLSKGGFRGNSCTLTAGLISPSPVVLTEIFCWLVTKSCRWRRLMHGERAVEMTALTSSSCKAPGVMHQAGRRQCKHGAGDRRIRQWLQ